MSFDALAPFYRSLEWLFAGQQLQRARVRFLPETVHCRRALVLGEGPGSFLVELLRHNPQMEVVCIERSPGRIRQARKRLENYGMSSRNVEFVEADVLDWPLTKNTKCFDLIAAHYFFDCFTEPQLKILIRRITSIAAPNALMLVADFNIPRQGIARWRALAIIRMLYVFFHLTTDLAAWSLIPPEPCLRTARFSLEQHCSANFGLVCSSLWRREANLTGS